MAIADVFDALTSVRPYKETWSADKVFEYLREESGKHLDPELVDVMLSIRKSIEKIRDKHISALH